MISYSDDMGSTYSHEIKRPLLGPDKNRLYHVKLYRQGSSFGRIYRLRHSHKSSFTLVEMFGDLQFGT